MVGHPITLTCKDVVELVTELLCDALPAGDRVRIEQHLLVCPPCTAHFAQVRSTIALAAGLRGAEDAEVAPDLLARFRQRKATLT